jgi:hypothetical protein
MCEFFRNQDVECFRNYLSAATQAQILYDKRDTLTLIKIMRTFVCSAILAVTHAIKSQSEARAASTAMVDAMVRSLARDMPQQLVQLSDSSSELRTLI